MCWALLDDQMDTCNCITGNSDGVFFKDVGEAINHFVNHEKRTSAASRKLQKLVEEEINHCLHPKSEPADFMYQGNRRYAGKLLQSLLDKSKRNE